MWRPRCPFLNLAAKVLLSKLGSFVRIQHICKFISWCFYQKSVIWIIVLHCKMTRLSIFEIPIWKKINKFSFFTLTNCVTERKPTSCLWHLFTVITAYLLADMENLSVKYADFYLCISVAAFSLISNMPLIEFNVLKHISFLLGPSRSSVWSWHSCARSSHG